MLNRSKILLFFGLVFVAVCERLWFDLGPNVELVTFATLAASVYLGRNAAVVLPLIVLAGTDNVLGNTNILFFTWSGYLVIALGSFFLRRIQQTAVIRTAAATLGAFMAGIWFYLWTNFGVWLLDSWGMYANDASGLFASYVNGLPFLKNQLMGNLVIVPAGFICIEIFILLLRKYSHPQSYSPSNA